MRRIAAAALVAVFGMAGCCRCLSCDDDKTSGGGDQETRSPPEPMRVMQLADPPPALPFPDPSRVRVVDERFAAEGGHLIFLPEAPNRNHPVQGAIFGDASERIRVVAIGETLAEPVQTEMRSGGLIGWRADRSQGVFLDETGTLYELQAKPPGTTAIGKSPNGGGGFRIDHDGNHWVVTRRDQSKEPITTRRQ